MLLVALFLFCRLIASESVQYFQFDVKGNMYVYGPGSGFSGPSVKVEPGFEMSEIVNVTQSQTQLSGDASIGLTDRFCMSQVSSAISSIQSQIIEPTPPKR